MPVVNTTGIFFVEIFGNLYCYCSVNVWKTHNYIQAFVRVFGCDNVIISEGSCPESLENAQAPDKVFIGGSSGNMDGIFTAIYAKNPKADIVVTAVSLETLNEAVKCFERYGTSPEITQIAAARTEKIGTHTMFKAQNPVFIISGGLA